MPRKARKVLTDSERLRDRAFRCRQLGDGAGDLKFAITLKALAEEYEGTAELADAQSGSRKQAAQQF
jgi:hypothetical protein